MRKIKILRIIARLNIGGPAIQATLLTRAFNNDEFESKLICGEISRGEGDMGYIAERYGVNPTYLPQLGRNISPLRDVAALWGIFKHIRKFKPDIVHTHTAKAGTLGRIAAVLANIPVKVHTFHGNIFQGYFNGRTTRFFLFIEKILARFTNTIIAISPGQKREIVEKYQITDSGRCRVIRLGFDLENFLNLEHKKKGHFREKFNFRNDDILVGIIGRLTSVKNHKMFIDAAGYLLNHAEPDLAERIKFVIVGDGELKGEIALYARFKGLAGKVFFSGWEKHIDEVYADMDIIALTSINEGTPVSLIEAMASSRPVIATDVGGVKDVLGEIGILVDPGDYKDMAEKMLELASSPEQRKKLGGLGRNVVKDIYSKERFTSELGRLYGELVMKKQKSKK